MHALWGVDGVFEHGFATQRIRVPSVCAADGPITDEMPAAAGGTEAEAGQQVQPLQDRGGGTRQIASEGQEGIPAQAKDSRLC